MSTRILTERDVRALLTMETCIEVVAQALMAASRGDAVLPLRSKMMVPGTTGLLGLMPACLGEPRCFGIKVVSVLPGNHGTPFDAHQGVVLLFEAEHGRLLGIMDASSITAIRTAAASAVATRALAREEAGDLAILGAGVQAASHLDAMRAVRPLRRVRVWSRRPESAAAFAQRESARTGLRIEVAASASEAVRDADLICTTTSSTTPVLEGAWIAEGAHVNAVGACMPAARELDAEAVRRARLFTDRRESLFNEAGDFLIARDEGAVTDAHVAGEVGEVLMGTIPGRTHPDEITLFESLGIGVEDLAAAYLLLERARATGTGVTANMGGVRQEHA